MRLLFDADGLIKCHRAGVLAVLLQTFPCVVPEAVFHEVVTRGKAFLHSDATEIELALAGRAEIRQSLARARPDTGLGSGELAVLEIAFAERELIVVSDDRRFLSELTTEGIPFVTPADVVVALVRRAVLTREEAGQALARLRVAIRGAAYWEALQQLSMGDEHREE